MNEISDDEVEDEPFVAEHVRFGELFVAENLYDALNYLSLLLLLCDLNNLLNCCQLLFASLYCC